MPADPKPFEKLSVSKIDTAEACLRYYHYEHVMGVALPIPPARQAVLDQGIRIDREVEEWVLGKREQVSGAAAAVAQYYPLPGQKDLVQAQRWVSCEWAGAPLVGKVDLITLPGARWGRLARTPKRGLVRVTDLKSVKDLKWAKTPEQLDANRQLLTYFVGIFRQESRDLPDLAEVSHVSVERGAPHRCQDAVRIVGRDLALEFEERDRPLVQKIIDSHGVSDTLSLPGADRARCDNWYGSKCPFYDRCRASSSAGFSLDRLLDRMEQDGRGGEGTRVALDAAARDSGGVFPAIPWLDEAKRELTETERRLSETPDEHFARVVASGRVGEFEGVFYFLSSFHNSPVRVQWIGDPRKWFDCPTAEHAFQIQKCLTLEYVERILSSPTASGAKLLGRQVALRSDWGVVRVEAMEMVVQAKFRQHPDLAARLLATGEAELVEGNDWGDSFWGFDCKLGRGENHLGKILMRVRSALKKEKENMGIINPPDANQNFETGLIEGPGTIWRDDTLQGKPYCSVVGTRHGQVFDLRLLANDYKFLVDCERQTVKRPDGTEIVKTTGGACSPDALVEGAARYEDRGNPAYRLAEPGVVANGKIDADRVRRLVLNPILRAWDARVSPPKPEEKPAPERKDDALEQIERAVSTGQGTAGGAVTDTSSEIAKLVSAGCTEYQAEKMVAAGVTDARLRAGFVTVQELAALPKFSERKAQDILDRYQKIRAKLNPEPDRETLERVQSGELRTVTQEVADGRVSELEAHVRELEGLLERLRGEKDQFAGIARERHERMIALEASLGQAESLADALEHERDDLLAGRAPAEGSPKGPSGYTIYIDCIPVEGVPCADFVDLLRPYLERVAAERNVPDVSLIEPGYKVPGMLTEALFRDPPAFCSFSVRSGEKLWWDLKRFFLDRRSALVQGIR